MVVSKSIRLIEQGQTACNSWPLTSGRLLGAMPAVERTLASMTMPVELKSATPSDSGRIAQLLIDARAAFMPYAPSAYTDEEIQSWVAASLVPSGDVILASANGETVGVMATKLACDCSWITQMVVDPAHVGHRIGSSLLAHALRILQPPIRLYTFQANTGARRFYERYGFRAIRFTDGRANEEHCPDILYELAASPDPVIRVTGHS
jgi:ribosomal protein S18 acetylase RimI-like enzyme